METRRIVSFTSSYTFPSSDYGKHVVIDSITIPTNPAVFSSDTVIFTADGSAITVPQGTYSQGSLVRKLKSLMTDYTVSLDKVTGRLLVSKGSSFSIVPSDTTTIQNITGIDVTTASTETDGTHTVTFPNRLNLMVESYVSVKIDSTIVGIVSLNTPYLVTETLAHEPRPVTGTSTITVVTKDDTTYDTDTLPISASIRITSYR